MQTIKKLIRSVLPRKWYRALLVPYHFLWAFLSALFYGFPAQKLSVIGVTGTKGKSSVTEMIASILTENGHKVAVSSTIHFKIGNETEANLFKMTLPGQGFLQKFLRKAVNSGCTHAVIELTSESALQFRHRFTFLDALVFTNLEKEHLESHGGIEKYFQAKFEIGKELLRSSKRPRAIIAFGESEYGKRMLLLPVEKQISFSEHDVSILTLQDKTSYEYNGETFTMSHPGIFSVRNSLAAIKTAECFDIPLSVAKAALEKLTLIPGRAEKIECGQDFSVVVDYAHTPDSLRALYDAYKERKICVLGNTGGGRDTWKRKEMGMIADNECAEVILTNEDPYDENPEQIVQMMKEGMGREPRIIMDRREAIRTALTLAKKGDVVLITGKGTDPYIMEANNTKTPWSDRGVAEEELKRLEA